MVAGFPIYKDMNQTASRTERLLSVQKALAANRLDAVICAYNVNVLLLSGYWPVTGSAVVIVTAEPRIILLVPEDAERLAINGWADKIVAFKSASLDSLEDGCRALQAMIGKTLAPFAGKRARIGCEEGITHLPATYVSQQVYGNVLPKILSERITDAVLLPADDLLKKLRMRPTAWERQHIRTACEIAARAYQHGAATLIPGCAETEAVLPFQHESCVEATKDHEVTRAVAFFYCMSGANAYEAYAAFQQSRRKSLQIGEPVLVHCNSCIDGYWTDLTRTYVLGEPDQRLDRIYDAILVARTAALNVIRPGVTGAEVDKVARHALADVGYGAAFKHPTGHGVGFNPIDHNEWPRIHPSSTDILEEGMIFNIEPGVYLPGYGGVRDCNMVAVTRDSYELLSPFHLEKKDWRLAIP